MKNAIALVSAFALATVLAPAWSTPATAEVVVNNVFSPGSYIQVGPGYGYSRPRYYGGYSGYGYTTGGYVYYDRPRSWDYGYYGYPRSNNYYYEAPARPRHSYYRSYDGYCWYDTDRDRGYGYWGWCR